MTCVASMLQQAAELNSDAEPRLKRCMQCFQDLEKTEFSKRQRQSVDGKCIACVAALEHAAAAAGATSTKWCYDQYYRSCHRGKTGGVAVRIKCNIASPILGFIPMGRVFCATSVIYNEQGDPMVKLASLACVNGISAENQSKARDGWVPCRSIRNEVFVEPHAGPFERDASPSEHPTNSSKYYRCVIEGCKARAAPDLALTEIGYVLYGDVVEVVEARVAPDGLVFLCLDERYFDGPAWVLERSLDNESVLNPIEGPSSEPAMYRCVQESGAPTRLEPSLASPPIGRIACGTLVRVVERIVNAQRQVFLRIPGDTATSGPRSRRRNSKKSSAVGVVDEQSSSASGKAADATESPPDVWVIETSTCCASVLIKLPML